jgi:hypothetical protein
LDPETTKIIPVVNFKYNETITSKSRETLAAEVSAAIVIYSDDTLEKHEAIFRYSPFVNLIDEVDPSILSNITTIKMSKTFLPTLGTATKYTIDYANAFFNPHSGHMASTSGITPGGILSSTGFKYTGDATNVWYYEDDGAGLVKAYYILSSAKVYKAASVGTIDYGTGIIVIAKDDIASVEDYNGVTQTYIRLTVVPSSNDIVPVRNQVLEIDTTNMSITGSADSIAGGSSDGGTTYSTSASYA